MTPPAPLLIALSVFTLLVAAWVTKRRLEANRPLEAMLALGIGSLLASPVSWTHHWLWVVPMLVVAVSRRWWIMSWALGMVFLIGPMALVPMGHFRELDHNWWQAMISSSYLFLGIDVLVRLSLGRARLIEGMPRSARLPASSSHSLRLPN